MLPIDADELRRRMLRRLVGVWWLFGRFFRRLFVDCVLFLRRSLLAALWTDESLVEAGPAVLMETSDSDAVIPDKLTNTSHEHKRANSNRHAKVLCSNYLTSHFYL